MATKHEIKKFLERKSIESINKLDTEKSRLVDEAVREFIASHSEYFAKINSYIGGLCRSYDELNIALTNDKTGSVKHRNYDTPEEKINRVSSAFTFSSVKDGFIIQSKVMLEDKFRKLIEESKIEYARLLAVIQTMSSKEAMDLLKSLGFDVSALEEIKQQTALITDIDAKKLYL